MGDCNPGLSNVRTLLVADEHTAISIGSGDVPVLGTPAVLTLAECACAAAIRDDLPDGETSVGAWAEVEHMKPVPVGSLVTAEATLRGHHGSRLEFVVIVRVDDDVVAKVRHRRVLVDEERFLAKLDKLAKARTSAA